MNTRIRLHSVATTAAALGLFVLTGCKTTEVTPTQVTNTPDYSRQLPDGAPCFKKLSPNEWPDLAHAFGTRDPLLMDALDRSVVWFTKPSSKTHFPIQGVSHEQAQASVIGMRELIANSTSAKDFMDAMHQQFDVYESVGYNGEGIVLYTGYFSPVLNASRERGGEFQYPLYNRPEDLVTDPKSGRPLGRKAPNGEVVPYYTRKEIEQQQILKGQELVWLPDALSAYIIHVNGSAKLRMRDGSAMYIGYAGKTDRPYASLGQQVIKAGLADRNKMSLSELRKIFNRDPQTITEMMNVNESYVFFREYPEGNWPAGSLGFPVASERSLATDKSVYPRGGLVLVDTDTISMTGTKKRFLQFMLDQDTGGAIKAPGRADIFMGVGPTAEIIAGGQYAEGYLYYIFVKPEYIDMYRPQTTRTAQSPAP